MALTATIAACGRERPKPPEPEEIAEGEGEGEEGEGEGEEGEGEGEGEEGEGEEGEGEEGEGEEGEGEEGEGEGEEGEGEGEGPSFCTQNADCDESSYCDRGSGECIDAGGCDPCDPTDICFPVGDQPMRCDNRFGVAGCCVPSCNIDEHCPEGEYCNLGSVTCEPGCRIGDCDVGLICGLDDRVCREGCLDDEDCPEIGRICDPEPQVCIDGCVDEEGCPEGERCDIELRECTVGCVEQADCGEGRVCHRAEHRCASRCVRDGDCLEGMLCDEELGGCVANPGGCLAAGCPEASCDPIRGQCVEDPGVACAPGDVGCEEGDPCVPTGDDAAFACAAPAGEGAAGAPCDTGADCRSGICLNDDTCYESCGAHEDCGEGLRCWTARFLVALSEELLDPEGDTAREVPACRIPPTPCLSPDTCEEGEECLPWWDPDAQEVATACRPGAAGERDPGDRCHTDDDCTTGICTDDGICLQVCDPGADEDPCGDLQICGVVPAQADGRDGQIPACVLDPGSGQACDRDADCPEGEACHPEADLDEGGEEIVTLRCRPGQGLGPAQLCQNSWECESGHCVNGRYCFGACTGEGDCPGGVPCQPQPSGVPGREAVQVSMCVEPNLPCARDGDCPLAGQACSPEPSADDPDELAPLCREAEGETRGGESCRRDRDCRSGYCIQELFERTCWEGCGEDADCADDMRCYDDVAPVVVGEDADAYDSLPACMPDRGSLDSCDSNADCVDGEVCAVVPSGDREDLNPRCVTALSDPAQDAEFCDDPARCSTGQCTPGNGFLPGTCLILCQVDADCPAAWFFGLGATCLTEVFDQGGVQDEVSYCAGPF